MDDQPDLQRRTEPRSALVPPGRRPPTAIGAATPEPLEPHHSHVLWHPSPLVRLLAQATNECLDILVDGLGRCSAPDDRRVRVTSLSDSQEALMPTWTARRRWSGVLGLAGMLVAGPLCGVAHAQEAAKPGVIPGMYRKGPCGPTAFPDELPAINAVLDSAALVPALASAGLEKSLVLSLRLGSLEENPPVRVLEKKGSSTVADRVLDAVRKTLRQVPPGDPWAFRLVVDSGNPPILRLARSELCPPAPEPPVTRVKPFRMEEGQAIQMQQQMQEEVRLRQMVGFRVLVQPNGKPADVVMTRSSGDPRIDREQQEAMRRTHFFPATLDGVHVAAWIEIGGGP